MFDGDLIVDMIRFNINGGCDSFNCIF